MAHLELQEDKETYKLVADNENEYIENDSKASLPSIYFDEECKKWCLKFTSVDTGEYDAVVFVYYYDSLLILLRKLGIKDKDLVPTVVDRILFVDEENKNDTK